MLFVVACFGKIKTHKHTREIAMANRFITVENASELPDLISDSDGVITDFSTAFHRFMESVHGHFAHVNEPENYNFSDAYPQHPAPWQHIKEFINNTEFFGNMGLYPDAVSAIKSLHSAGVRVRIITSVGDSEEVKRARLNVYDREISAYIDDVTFLPLASSKSDSLRKYDSSFFLDDLAKECHGALESDHKPFLFHRRYNALDPLEKSVTRLKSGWVDLPYFER